MKLIFPKVTGTIEVYMDVLRAICGDTAGKSMIDLGCCFAPNTPKLGFSERRYVDVIDRVLDHPEEQQFFVKIDAMVLDEAMHNAVDVAISSDMIEHLYPEAGKEFIEMIQRISRKQIIFTPLGEIFPLHNTGPDDPEAHHSLWTPEDFPGWGCIVFPDYHREWNGGGFFAYKCDDLENEKSRVWKELMQHQWANTATIIYEP